MLDGDETPLHEQSPLACAADAWWRTCSAAVLIPSARPAPALLTRSGTRRPRERAPARSGILSGVGGRAGIRAGGLVGVAIALAVVAATVAGTAPGSDAQLERVTAFGDSQLEAVAETPEATAMLATGIELDLRTAVCRRLVQASCPYQGKRPPTVLDEVRAAGDTLGKTVVLLVGYNDFEAEWPADVTDVLRALEARGATRVLWLTLTERRQDWARMNATLRSLAGRWPQLEVLDWSDAADPSWFRDDDIHLTPAGAMGLASYLHAALAARGIAAPSAAAVAQVSLRVSIRGRGSVTLKGATCRASCSRPVAVGSAVRLVARAPAGWVFDRWGGACSGSGRVCSLEVKRASTVVARFRPR